MKIKWDLPATAPQGSVYHLRVKLHKWSYVDWVTGKTLKDMKDRADAVCNYLPTCAELSVGIFPEDSENGNCNREKAAAGKKSQPAAHTKNVLETKMITRPDKASGRASPY